MQRVNHKAHRNHILLHVLAALSLVLSASWLGTLPASSDPGDGGRWIWDEEHQQRVFIPFKIHSKPPAVASDRQTSPDGPTSPYIEAEPQYDWVYGWDWPVGNTVYVCVDSSAFAADPTNPSQCDLYASSMVASGTYGMVNFNVWSFFDLQGGEYIAMTDTMTTKQHQVTMLTVTEADAATDTVSGTADPGTTVDVYEYDGYNWLYPVTNGSGDWIADYNGIYDLVPGSSGSASQDDLDGDTTWWSWEIPNPTIEAAPFTEQIYGWDWPVGNTINVCVDSLGFAADPTNPAQCNLYHDSMVAYHISGTVGMVVFDVNGEFDLQGGDYISMTDTVTTKEHQVTNITVTGADPSTDTVYGTADAGTSVTVLEYDGSNWLSPITDGLGDWVANYKGTSDLIPGSSGFASQRDADSDQTRVYWEIPNPRISAQPVSDGITGYEWPQGETVYVCVDDSGFAADPTDPGQCDLYHSSAVVPPPANPGWPTIVSFNLGGSHDLQGGDYIVMTDGVTRKEHQVTELTVTGVDPDTDIVSGTAASFSDVEVSVNSPTYEVLDVVAAGSGVWQADFSGLVDLDVGVSGQAAQYDGDDDETDVRWGLYEPWVDGFLVEDEVYGYYWPNGSTVYLCINEVDFASDPTNPAECSLYADSAVATIPPGYGDTTEVFFDLSGIFDLQPGQYLSLSDGTMQRDLQLANLSLTGWGIAADTLSGTADPDADVSLAILNCSGCWLDVTANGSGNWTADFTGIADLQPGTEGLAVQPDSDGDYTDLSWSIPIYELFLPLIMR